MGRSSRRVSGHHGCELVTRMDAEQARAILEEAHANIAACDAEREQRETDLLRREAADGLLLAPVRRQRKVSRETVEDATMPEAAPALDKQTLERWENWANALMQAKLQAFAEIVGAEVAQAEKQLVTQFAGELKRLDDKIAELNAVVEQLAGELDILRAKNVTALPTRGAAHG